MTRWTVLISAGLLAGSLIGPVHAADPDSRNSREREMLRRAQEALRQSEAEKSDLSRARLDAEQKLKTLTQELETARNGSRSGQAALRSQLQAAAAAQTDLQGKLDESNRQVAALTSRQRDTAGQLAAREAEVKQLQQDLQTTKATGASCEAKNIQLYQYSQELLDRYRSKGVWAALSQKEPLLGLKEVKMENIVQEYHDKLASQRIATPPPAPTTPENVSPARQNAAH